MYITTVLTLSTNDVAIPAIWDTIEDVKKEFPKLILEYTQGEKYCSFEVVKKSDYLYSIYKIEKGYVINSRYLFKIIEVHETIQ